MPNFAIIEDGVVVNTVEATADLAAQEGWIELPPGYQSGDEFDGINWKSNAIVLTVEQLKAQSEQHKASAIRAVRDQMLLESDWTQAADVPQSTKDKWSPYRQALRDVPQQAGFPDSIVWPTKPQ